MTQTGLQPSDVRRRRLTRARRRLRVVLWRRRHLVAAAALASAAIVVVEESRDDPPPTEPVVVLEAALPAGSLLETRDVAAREIPAGLAPEGALADPAAAIGSRLAVALPPGFPLAPSVLIGPGLTVGAPPGTAVVPVRLADSEVTGLLRAGDRIDLVQTPADGGAPRVLAHRVLVMATTSADAPGAFDVGVSPGPLLLVATTPEVATVLAGASAWDPLSVVLVADGP